MRKASGELMTAMEIRSRPPPKSTLRCGSSSNPSSVRLYCMKTEFPIST